MTANIEGGRLYGFIALLVLGVYFLLFHRAPFPLNHESLGLFNHMVHAVLGVVLLAGAGYLWWKG